MLRRKHASGPSDSLRDRAREKFYDDITSRYPSSTFVKGLGSKEEELRLLKLFIC